MAKHQWVMMAVYNISFDEARRMRTETNERPVDLGRHNLKELRGPLCDNCGALFDVVVVYDRLGDRIETPCFSAGAKGLPAPEVRFGERPDEGEPVRESAGPVSPDQPGQQGDHEGTGMARQPEGGELRLLSQRTDQAGGEVLLQQGVQPVQQGQPERTGPLSSGACFCDGACGEHEGQPCRRTAGFGFKMCESCGAHTIGGADKRGVPGRHPYRFAPGQDAGPLDRSCGECGREPRDPIHMNDQEILDESAPNARQQYGELDLGTGEFHKD